MRFERCYKLFGSTRFDCNPTIGLFSPNFLQATHWATFPVAESCIPDVNESASHTGDVEVISQPSAIPDMRPHTLHAPVERHLYEP